MNKILTFVLFIVFFDFAFCQTTYQAVGSQKVTINTIGFSQYIDNQVGVVVSEGKPYRVKFKNDFSYSFDYIENSRLVTDKIHAFDIDRDGIKDMLTYPNNGVLSTYINRDEYFDDVYEYFNLNASSFIDQDFDGDGNNELIINGRVYRHLADGSIELVHSRLPSNDYNYENPFVHDVDGDGTNEIVFELLNNLGYLKLDDNGRLRQNLFSAYNETSTWMDYINTKKGIQCIFYTAGKQMIKRLNIANGLTTIDTLVEGQPNYGFNTLRADLNGNGNQELIIYNRSANRQYLLSYDDVLDEFSYRELGFSASGGFMYIEDMRDQPVLAAVQPSGMSFYQFDNDLNATLLTTQTTSFNVNPQSFTDVDGDGYTDVWNPFNIRNYYGGQVFGAPTNFSLPSTGGNLVDFDGDNDADYVLDSVWYRNEGNFQFSSAIPNPNFKPYPDPEVFFTKIIYEGDIDGDGDIDLLTYNFFGEPFELIENNNNDSFNDPVTLADSDLISGNLLHISVEDYNNDGLKDILMVAASGMVYWPQTGGLSFATGVTLFEGADRPRGIDVMDGDGDGFLDVVLGTGTIIAGSSQGKTLLYKGSLEGPKLVSEIEDNSGYKYPKFIDHDNDGAQDIIVADGDDLYIFDFKSYTNDATPKQVISNEYDKYGDYIVKDVDNDGDDDVILYDDGTIAFLYLLKDENLNNYTCPKNDVYLYSANDLTLYDQYFRGCKVINGSVFVGGTSGWSDISGIGVLNGVDTIYGNLTMQFLNQMDHSSNPFPELDFIGKNLYLHVVRNLPNTGFSNLEHIGGDLTLKNMLSSDWSEETFPSLEHIGGSIDFSIADISSLKPLINGSKLYGDLRIDDTWYDALPSIQELLEIDTILGELHISTNLQHTIDETENIKYFGGISIGGKNVKNIKLTSQQDTVPGVYSLITVGDQSKITHENKIEHVNGVFRLFGDTIPNYINLTSTGSFSISANEISSNNFNKLEETESFNFALSKNHDYSNFINLSKIKGDFSASRNAISFDGLELLDSIYQSLRIYNNDYLTNIKSINKDLYVGDTWSMVNNSILNFCDVPALCNHLESGRDYLIQSNASECDDISDISCLENSISGVAFYDYNKDGIYDSNTDALLSNIHLSYDGEQSSTITSDNGFYRKFLLPGQQFKVEASTINDFVLSTPHFYQIDSFVPDVTALDTFDFGFFTQNETAEFSSNITSTLFICDRTFDVFINLKNVSHTIGNGYLEVHYPEEFTLDSTYQGFTMHDETKHILQFEVADVYPFFNWEVTLPFTAPSASELNNQNMNVKIQYYDENTNLSKLIHENSLPFGLLCSYDPNDKLVTSSDDSGHIREGQSDDELTYTIRFQNTGNFYAEDVRITDVIDEGLDLSTFTFLDASHDVEITMNDRTITFMFDDIFLIDSTTSFAESQGFVTFSIKPVSFDLGEEFENDANIFFDFNDPILTNKVVSEVYDPSVAVVEIDDHNLIVYPQPGYDKLYVKSGSFELIDQPFEIKSMQGACIKKDRLGADLTIDLIGVPTGLYVLSFGERHNKSMLISIVK